MQPVSSQRFWELFRDPEDRIGQDLTEEENTTFYVSKDQAGKERVGEARQDRRTTSYAYRLLEGELAEMVLYWYRVKPVEDIRREIGVLIMTCRAMCERCIKLGCDLPSIHDALGHLLVAEKQARRGQHLTDTTHSAQEICTQESAPENLRTHESAQEICAQVGVEKSAHAHLPPLTPTQQAALDAFVRSGRTIGVSGRKRR